MKINLQQSMRLAKAHERDGLVEQAVEVYEEILGVFPQNARARANLNKLKSQTRLNSEKSGFQRELQKLLTLYEQGGFADVIAAAEPLTKKNGSSFDLWNLLGAANARLEIFAAAEKCFKNALELNQNYADGHQNLGSALREQGKLDAAIEYYNKAIALNPDHAEAHHNLGNVLKEQGRLHDAETSIRKALDLVPEFPEALHDLGNTLKGLGRLEEGLESIEKSLFLKPVYDEAQLSKSLVLLMLGRFEAGWKNYEWRWTSKTHIFSQLKSTKPEWALEKGARVLLWAEQGVGDHVMFAAIVQEMLPLCSELLIKTDKRLIPLFKRSFGSTIRYCDDKIDVDESEYDYQIAMGSTLQFFRNHETDFLKSHTGYLMADAGKKQALRTALKQSSDKKLVGISWDSKNEKKGRQRSLQLTEMMQSLNKPDVQFVNLQYGNVERSIREAFDKTGISIAQIDQIDNFDNLDGLAALISACDVVVSIDNSTVHLAGALGVDVRVLLPFACEWRWQTERSDSYWYKSMTLYRQEAPGDWQGALAKLAQEI